MEASINILHNIRTGSLRPLHYFFESNPDVNRRKFINTLINRQSLLTVAAKHGHLNIVRHLVEQCEAEVDLKCRIDHGGHEIEDATALWTAAASGHLEIVKFLVEKGAKVNAITRNLSTPLRAACYDGHLNTVKFLVENGADINYTNLHGNTCLMIACYKGHIKIVRYLIEKGVEINRQSSRGYTALHDCADQGHVSIMKELLDSGAKMIKDQWGVTPLFAAAMSNQENVYKFLVSYDTRLELQNRPPLCTDIEKISALEMMGAAFVDKMIDLPKAVKLWRKALEIRQSKVIYLEEQNEDPDVIDTYVKKPGEPIPSMDNVVEFTTLDELDQIKNNPEAIRIQALIIRVRVLGPTHPETLFYIRHRGARYADIGALDVCYQHWLYALRLEQKSLEPLSQETENMLLSFADLFSFMAYENVCVNLFDKMFTVLTCAKKELDLAIEQEIMYSSPSLCVHYADVEDDDEPYTNNKDAPDDAIDDNPNQQMDLDAQNRERPKTLGELRRMNQRASKFLSFERILTFMLYVIGCLYRFRQKVTETQNRQLRQFVYDLVRSNYRTSIRQTPLHIACTGNVVELLNSSNDLYDISSPDLVRLLLECGADPNALDENRNSPVHVACLANKTMNFTLVKLLIEFSAHLDFRNVDNEIPLCLISELKQGHKSFKPMRFLSLKCLCARVLSQHQIAYKGTVPAHLNMFIKSH